MTTTQKLTANRTAETQAVDALKLKSSDTLSIRPGDSDQANAFALAQRQQVNRDAQTELAIDSAYRAKEQELVTAQFAARKSAQERDILTKQISAQEANTSRWQLLSGAGAVGTLLAGALWLRTRRQLREAPIAPDSSDTGDLFDTTNSDDANTLATQSALLPGSEFDSHTELDIRDGLWSADETDDLPSHATLHEFDDAAPYARANHGRVRADVPANDERSDAAHTTSPGTLWPMTQAAGEDTGNSDFDEINAVEEVAAQPPLVTPIGSLQTPPDQLSAQASPPEIARVALSIDDDRAPTATAAPAKLDPTADLDTASTELKAGLQTPPTSPSLQPVPASKDVATLTDTPAVPEWLQSPATTAAHATPEPQSPTPIKDLRQALFNSLKRTPTKSGGSSFAATAMPSHADMMLSDGFSFRELADVQWVPQPMQDLLLLYRGLQEWEGSARFGVAEQAILHHINLHTATSGWVYLELLYIYRRLDQRKAFDQWADTFRTRFNRLAPTWTDAQDMGKELLRYDLATLQLTQAWANNSVIWLLEEWLVGEPHMRRLMDINAFRDVLMLYELSLMVNDNPYKPITRPKRPAQPG